jgi:hypothetical protein
VRVLPRKDGMVAAMARYSFLLFLNGDVIGQTDCPCADDLEAVEVAHAFSGYQSVEIYSKNRLVACVKQGDAHADTGNRHPG